MSNELKLVAESDVSGATGGLKEVQSELGKTAIAAQKTDTSLSNLGKSATTTGAKSTQAAKGLSDLGGKASAAGKEAIDAAGGLSELGQSLLAGGIVAGAALAISALSNLYDSFFGLSKAQKALNESLESGGKGFKSAFADVQSLRTEMDLLNKGVGSGEDFLKHYNETMGKVVGTTDDLTTAEKNLVQFGDTYIQYMFAKAVATGAFSKAAEKALESLQLNSKTNHATSMVSFALKGAAKDADDAKDKLLDYANAATRISEVLKSQFGSGADLGMVGKLKEQIDALQKQQPFLKTEKDISANVAAIKRLQDELDNLLGKQKRKTETISDVFSKLASQIDLLNTKQLLFGTDEAKQKISAIEQAIERLVTKFKLDPQGGLIQKLFGDIKKIKDGIPIDLKVLPLLSIDKEASIPEQLKNLIRQIEKQKPPTDVAGNTITIKPSIVLDSKEAKKQVDDLFAKLSLEERFQKLNADIDKNINDSVVSGLASIGESLGKALVTGEDPIRAAFNSMLSTIAGGLRAIGESMIKFGIAKTALSKLKSVPGPQLIIMGFALELAAGTLQAAFQKTAKGFATGVRNFGGGWADVGERGRERVFLPGGSSVMPNAQLNATEGQHIMISGQFVQKGVDMVLTFNKAQALMSRNGW